MANKTEIYRDDIIGMSTYENIRNEKRVEISKIKNNRRLAVGPYASFYFECFETMWYQIHEMLRIEKGGETQIRDEILAYNPLIPKGNELVATVMFEIPDAVRRTNILSKLGGVEETITMEFSSEKIYAKAEMDIDRTTSAGKASSVHFVHFNFNPKQIEMFKDSTNKVSVAIEHQNYGHMTVMPDNIKEALLKDFS